MRNGGNRRTVLKYRGTESIERNSEQEGMLVVTENNMATREQRKHFKKWWAVFVRDGSNCYLRQLRKYLHVKRPRFYERGTTAQPI